MLYFNLEKLPFSKVVFIDPISDLWFVSVKFFIVVHVIPSPLKDHDLSCMCPVLNCMHCFDTFRLLQHF